MHAMDFSTLLEGYEPKEQIPSLLRSLRHDEQVWAFLLQASGEQADAIQALLADKKLNPGTLGLLTFAPDLVKNAYPDCRLTAAVLEDCMAHYERHIQQREVAITFETAAKLAIVLVEKRKISPSWSVILLEMSNRMRITSEEEMHSAWGSPLVIAANLDPQPGELLTDLFKLNTIDQGLKTFIHVLLSLPITAENQIQLISEALQDTPLDLQEKVVNSFMWLNEPELAEKTAEELLKKNKGLQIQNENHVITRFSLEESVQKALQLKRLAGFAQIAGENELAQNWLDQSAQAFEFLARGVKFQRAGANRGSDSENTRVEQELNDAHQNSEIWNEKTVGVQDERTPFAIIQAAKRIYQAGNPALAKAEVDRGFATFQKGNLGITFTDYQPNFDPTWRSAVVVNDLLDMECYDLAAAIADEILRKNPTSVEGNLLASRALIAAGNPSAALPKLEWLAMIDPQSGEVQRELAECYQKTGNLEDAYRVRKRLIEKEGAPVNDLIDFAQAALKVNQPSQVFEATSKVLAQVPDHAAALALNGAAHALVGESEKAYQSLTQAIELGTDDPQPWILLAELYQRQNNLRQAIETLRNGQVSLPSNLEIRQRLAETLMLAGLAAEALPILNELTRGSKNLELMRLQSKAMKTLGLVEYGDQIARMYESNPFSGEIAFDYAEELIRQGNRDEARKVIEAVSNVTLNTDVQSLIYADVYIGLDFQNEGEPKTLRGETVEKATRILDDVLSQDPENQKAQLLRAETLLQQNQHQVAFERYSNLIGKQNLVEKSLFERIQAGFALSAAFLGKFEIALAAIREAVALKPEWIGLNKLMARIYAMAGEVNEALVQAERVLMSGSQLYANLIWFIDFAVSIGKHEAAEEKLRAELEVQPENKTLRVKLAEVYLKSRRLAEAQEVAESIKNGLSTELADSDLAVCASLFAALGDMETVQTCLKFRVEKSNSVAAVIELAASHYKQSEFDECIQLLAGAPTEEVESDWAKIFGAETLFKVGELDAALDHLKSVNPAPESALQANPVILPSTWNQLLMEKDPLTHLKAIIAFTAGKIEICAEVLEPWILQDPQQTAARIMTIETAFASGDKAQIEKAVNQVEGDFSGELADHHTGLMVEALVDGDRVIDAQKIRETRIDSEDACLKAAGIRLMILTGHLAEAEYQLDQLMVQKPRFDELDLHIRVGILRNLVKSAVMLKRWNEALALGSESAVGMPWNQTSVMLYLTTLVQACEFANSSEKLSVEAHNPSVYLQNIKVEDEINWATSLLKTMDPSELERWLLRGKMAIAPTTENIRSFAMVTPDDQDVASMVAALGANGQTQTGVQVARKFTNSAPVQFALAVSLLDVEPAGALDAVNTCLTHEPLFPTALVLRSLIWERDGKIDLAINDLEEAISDWSNESAWRVRAANLWQRIGNLPNAIRQLRAAHENKPEDAAIAINLSRLLLSVGQGELSIELMESLSTNNPNQYEIWEVLTDAYAQTGKMEEALVAAKKASNINPYSTRPYLMSGKIHLEQGQLDLALAQAKKAADQNKKDAEAILFLAKVLNERGEKQQALATLEMTRNCDNATVQTMIEHVNLVRDINGGANAKELIASMASQYPENVELMKLLANAQVENGDVKDAELTAKRALLVDPEEADLHLFLGKINAESGQLDQAVHHLSQGITRKAEKLEGYLILSKVYEQQREFSKAIETLQKAIEINPDDPRCYTAIASLYKNAKNYTAAEKALQKAAELDPRDVSIRRQLGALLALNLVHHSQEVSSQS